MKTLALIEDNPDNRMLIVAFLEDHFNIDEYEDGPSALEGMSQAPPDAILLDISLPGMDGTEVLQKLKEGPLATCPVVALTAHAMEGDKEKFLSMGFDQYISKPILDDEIFLQTVEALFNT